VTSTDSGVDGLMHPVSFRTSDGRRYWIDWHIDEAMRRDPEGVTLSSRDLNELLLTANKEAIRHRQEFGFPIAPKQSLHKPQVLAT